MSEVGEWLMSSLMTMGEGVVVMGGVVVDVDEGGGYVACVWWLWAWSGRVRRVAFVLFVVWVVWCEGDVEVCGYVGLRL